MTINKESFIFQEQHVAALVKNPMLIWLEEAQASGLVTLFPDATPVIDHPIHANINSVQAYKQFMSSERHTLEPLVEIGSMGSGKSTTLIMIILGLRNLGKKVKVYTHTFDKERSGSDGKIMIQAGKEGLTVDVKAILYEKVEDLIDFSDTWKKGDYIAIDEFMFAKEEKEDPPSTNQQTIQNLLKLSKQKKAKPIISGLHSDFKGKVWPNMWHLMQNVNIIYEFHGRCDTESCTNPSELTARRTGIINSKGEKTNRPSSIDEIVCRVGNVLSNGETTNDTYHRACRECHKVLSPQQAKKFDMNFDT